MICRTPLAPRARRVALVLMDVDGVMTDGRLVLLGSDREAKAFDAKDGVGVWLARRAGLRTGLISGRGSAAVLRRANELGMDEVHLKVEDKLGAYRRILKRRGLTDAEVCYIGDDLVDLPILEQVGMSVAVADAHPEVLRRTRFITRARGGRGAVREVIDAILRAQGKWTTIMGWFTGAEEAKVRTTLPAPRRPRS